MTKKTKRIVNVEFGNEFGDMNAAKQYEVSASNKEQEKKSKKKK